MRTVDRYTEEDTFNLLKKPPKYRKASVRNPEISCQNTLEAGLSTPHKSSTKVKWYRMASVDIQQNNINSIDSYEGTDHDFEDGSQAPRWVKSCNHKVKYKYFVLVEAVN